MRLESFRGIIGVSKMAHMRFMVWESIFGLPA